MKEKWHVQLVSCHVLGKGKKVLYLGNPFLEEGSRACLVLAGNRACLVLAGNRAFLN
jgi:hypothetical protein